MIIGISAAFLVWDSIDLGLSITDLVGLSWSGLECDEWLVLR